jgi:hypothetical protein
MEMIQYEKMNFPAKENTVYHEYSDSLSPAAKSVPRYSLEEVLAEKLSFFDSTTLQGTQGLLRYMVFGQQCGRSRLANHCRRIL